jgi:beta-phosphoglucomutase family hydrolase
MTGAVLWDLDGTLVDSEEYHWRAWRDTMAAEEVRITREQFLATFGWRNDAIIPRWLADATPERIERIGETKEVNYRRLVRSGGLTAAPGAEQWLRRLQQEGWRQAVASSAPCQNIDVVLDVLGLRDCFQAIVSAEDVHRGKPDPEVFLLAAERVGTDAARSIVVEDAAAGIEAARRAGMRSIGVKRGGGLPGADLEVDSLDALPPDAFTRLLRIG